MGRHDWAERAATPDLALAPGRLRVLIGRSAVIVLVIGALSWISVSIVFNPPPAGPKQIQSLPLAVDGSSSPEGKRTVGQEQGGQSGQPPPAGTVAAGARAVVHVIGAVKKPGVYELPMGSRALDAVNRAGGMQKNAAPDAVNLAAEIADGQQLRIPFRGERSGAAAQTPDGSTPRAGAAGGPLNINTATSAELEALPGIGPALAKRIIDFRQTNGAFKNLAELDAVSGIGPAMLATLRPKVEFK
ncbi:helix-hairpin-helix domain-containing protein [Paeniglutamicibacter sp. NPDC012692]|uniref:helix-hairpin-helix domain-containing protein n=1 Tax=Paeniglutamicibacter sp. NPDC012692 TaxID=3364388 RepID=UPI00368B5F9C